MLFRFVISLVAITGPFLVSNASALEPGTGANPYPLPTCVVSGEALDTYGDPVVENIDGRELRFCTESCVRKFVKNPAPYTARLDQAIIDQQIDVYPTSTCVVSGQPLGGTMGPATDHVADGRLVRFCCKACRADFERNPTSFIDKLDAAAIAAQIDTYPSTTCPISGQELGSMGEPHDRIFAGRLVRLCCAGCLETFNDDPIAAMSTVYGEEALQGGGASHRSPEATGTDATGKHHGSCTHDAPDRRNR